jgi:hypothetical protein
MKKGGTVTLSDGVEERFRGKFVVPDTIGDCVSFWDEATPKEVLLFLKSEIQRAEKEAIMNFCAEILIGVCMDCHTDITEFDKGYLTYDTQISEKIQKALQK